LALILSLSALALISADRSTLGIELSYNQVHQERAFYLAEAGYQHAFSKIKKDPAWREGFANQAFGSGVYTVEVIDSDTDSSLAETLLVVSSGECNGAVSIVQAWLVPGVVNPFGFALFSDEDLSMKQGACTDSYRADSGTYLATMLQEDGDVGSNNMIILSQDATVGGDAASAVPGGIILGSNAAILGSQSTGVPPTTLNLIPDTEYDSAKANNYALSGLSGSNFTYTTTTNKLSVKSNGFVNLAGGMYYFSDVSIKQNGRLTITPGAKVTIYIVGNITLQQDASMNDGGIPSDMIVFSKGMMFSMFQDSKFYGAFYGPSVVFKGRQDMGMYGAVVARSVSIHQDACFHYDRGLGEYSKAGAGGISTVAWREL
ncbi:MAG: hypothetical protein IH914_07225, partial [candidate division Zixibacteria bacterium]|nr:hypothetical protein [candidate division Zixibacteria bacterium]